MRVQSTIESHVGQTIKPKTGSQAEGEAALLRLTHSRTHFDYRVIHRVRTASSQCILLFLRVSEKRRPSIPPPHAPTIGVMRRAPRRSKEHNAVRGHASLGIAEVVPRRTLYSIPLPSTNAPRLNIRASHREGQCPTLTGATCMAACRLRRATTVHPAAPLCELKKCA